MTPPSAPPDRRATIIELVVALAALGAVHFFIGSEATARLLPKLPIINHAWLLFLMTMALAAWMVRRHGGTLTVGLRGASVRRTILVGVGGTIASLAVDIVTGPIIRSLLGPTELRRFEGIEGNTGVYLILLVAVFLFGGIGEELLYRGMVFTRLRSLLGATRAATATALLLQAAIFGLVHSYQGPSGMVSVAIGGVMYGLMFLLGRSIWAPAIAHGLTDALGMTLLYLGVMKTS